MTLRSKLIIIAFLALALAGIVNMVRKRSLELKYCLAWFACVIILIIFTLFPGTMTSVAELLGIYSPVNMIFFMGFIFSMVIIFSLTVALSRATANLRRLAQTMALDKEDLQNTAGQEEKQS